jgi:AraC-like DNA-binding protein
MQFKIDEEIEKRLVNRECNGDHYCLLQAGGTQQIDLISGTVTIIIFLQHAKIQVLCQELCCCPGNVLLLKERCQYSLKTESTEQVSCGAYILNIDDKLFSDFFYTQISNRSIFYDFFKIRSGSPEYLFFDNTENTPVYWAGRQLLWEATFTSLENEEIVLAALVLFLVNLHSHHQEHLVISESSMMQNYAFKAGCYLKYMADHYETVTLKSIADQFGYSPAYFSTMFKKTLSVTFTEKLLEIKLECAKRLLISTGLTIEEIALRTGFTEKSYFHRSFKQKLGMTPRKYRDLNR